MTRLAAKLAALALLAVCAVAPAAEPVASEYRIVPRRFNYEDGAPQSGVNAIVQDREGYLWLGTFGGLARFDGSAFRVFRERSAPDAAAARGAPRTGPASDRIISLMEDDRGRLWIGTQDAGVSVSEHGAFRHLPVCGGICEVSDIEQGPDRAIWLATAAGVFRLDPESMRATRLGRSAPGSYNHVAIDRNGEVFVGGYEGFHIVAGDQLRRIPLPDVDDSHVSTLHRDGDGLLVGTGLRLYRYRHQRALWLRQDVSEPKYAAHDARGRWLVAQRNGRVVREEQPGRWREIAELSGLGVSALAFDGEGNLWIGTGSKGLLRLRDPVFGLLSEAQLGTGAAGRAVVADGRGGYWLGLACGALRHLDADGRVQRWPIRDVLGNDCVSSLWADGQGALWVGTSSGVLGRLRDGALLRIGSWHKGDAIGIWPDGDDGMLVNAGTSTYRMQVDAGGRLLRRRPIAALEGMHVNRVVPGARGGTWFLGDQGALRLVEERVVERWSPREGLSSRFARALYEDGDGVLWIGTYGGGLNRVEGGRVQRYGSENGLPDEAVSCILPDSRGRLWLGGNRGVTLLPEPGEAGESIKSVLFAAYDGLVPPEINGGTSSPCLRDAQGRLWLSLVEGFAVLDPARIGEDRPAPLRAHIEDVEVAGGAGEIADGVLRLASFTRNLQIRYAAINLSRPRETRFRFRLSGFDADWVDAGQNRSILYPSVPWGEHLFEVQARVAGGPWSPAAELRILHPQPWYQRPWIWTLATSMGLVVLLGTTRHERVRPLPEPRPRPARGARRGRLPS